MVIKTTLTSVFILLLAQMNYSFQGSGNALDFDGVNDYVSLSTNATNVTSASLGLPTSAITVEAWVEADAFVDYGGFFGFLQDNGATESGFVIGTRSTDNFYVGLAGGGNGLTYLNSGSTYNTNERYHVAFTYDGTTINLYINGQLDATSGAESGNIFYLNSRLVIGSYQDNDENIEFDGTIDEVRMWNVTRTQTQIRNAMCQKLAGNETGLVGYWRLDETSGTTVTDEGIAGNTGTIQNSATRITSPMPIGNVSANTYGGASLSLTSTETVNLSNFVGSPAGVHLYKVTEAPNITTAPGAYSSLETSGYFGIFIVGGTLPTYLDVAYTYTANGNVNGVGNEAEAEVAVRSNNATSEWFGVTQTINTTTNVISIPKHNSRELIIGFKPDDYPSRPGSGFSLLFDGTDDYVEGNDIAQHMTTNEFTLEAWVYPTASGGDNAIATFNTNTGGNSFEMGKQGNRFYVYTPTEGYVLTPTATYPDNNWYHIAFTVTASSSVSFYVNGILISTFATTTDVNILDNVFSIGQEWDGGSTSDFYDGYIEEVKVWRKDLTQTNIRDWMCKTVTTSHPEFNDLVGLFSFDEGVGAVAEDQISAVQGTIIGTEQWRLSGAPIGDESAYTYGGANVTLTDTDAFTINNFGGGADGYHIYKVNQAPDITTPPSGVNSLETSRYFGVFPINGATPTFDFSYNYTANTNVNGVTEEDDAVIVRRAQAGNIWNTMSHNQDAVGNTITASNHIEGQYIIGWANAINLNPPGAGAALDFDGVDDYVSLGSTNSFGNATDFTIELWMKTSSSRNDPAIISDKDWASGANDGFVFAQTGSTWKVNVGDGSNRIDLNALGTINDDKWHHLVLVCDRDGNAVAYQDGVSVGTTSMASIGNINSGNTIKIGQDGTGAYSSVFIGQIDEVRIWDVALSQTTIRDWMCKKVTNTHPNYANMLSYYRFDDGINTTAEDIRNSNDATLNNFGLLAATSNWVTSSAPLGDVSMHTYGGTSLTHAVTLSGSMSVSVTAGTADLIHIYQVAEDPNVVLLPGGYTNHDDNYWGVHSCGTGVVYTATYDYNTNDNVLDDSGLVMAFRANNADPNWLNSGGTVDTGANTITMTGMTGTEYFLGGNAPGALPITLKYFKGDSRENIHRLEWVTSSEVNNDYFELERSLDGINFEMIGTVAGAGTTSDEQAYEFSDINPVYGNNYYRLKQVDYDTQSSYSDDLVLLVNNNKLERLGLKVFPNPTRSSDINVIIDSPDLERNMQLIVYDIYGREYYRRTIGTNHLHLTMLLQPDEQLKSGMYMVVVEQGSQRVQKKLLVE